MAEKRYKKYKFIKKQMALNLNQNQISRDTVEESIGIIRTNSQTINDPVLSNMNQSFDCQITNNINYTADDACTAFRNLKLLTFLKIWSLENKINHSQLNSLLKGLKDIFPGSNQLAGSSEIDTNFLNLLPLESINSINQFDAIISENTEKFNSLVQLLYLVGGDTNKRIIYNMLRKLLTNEAASYYSGQGRKKKLPFVNLKLYDAVMTATRRRQNAITEVEIRQCVSLFLATAKSRM